MTRRTMSTPIVIIADEKTGLPTIGRIAIRSIDPGDHAR